MDDPDGSVGRAKCQSMSPIGRLLALAKKLVGRFFERTYGAQVAHLWRTCGAHVGVTWG